MSFFDEVKKVVDMLAGTSKPDTVEVKYGPGSGRAGQLAGYLCRNRGAGGAETWSYVQPPKKVDAAEEATSRLHITHAFDDLTSLKAWAGFNALETHECWIGDDNRVQVLSLEAPERGTMQMALTVAEVTRHLEATCEDDPAVVLSHQELSEFFDVVEDFLLSDSKMLAKMVRVFQYARNVSAELNANGSTMLRTTFDAKAGDAAPMMLPDEFSLYIPYFDNLDDNEAKHATYLAKVGLRVVPPRTADGQPTFRLMWKNQDAVLREARRDAVAALKKAVPANWRVYVGVPAVTKYAVD